MAFELLETLFTELTDAQAAEFVREQDPKSDSKESKLFDLLLSKVKRTPAQMSTKIYGSENMQAYQSLRKRALQKLEEYISRIRIEAKHRKRDSRMSDLVMAEFCIEHKLWDAARQYLQDATRASQKFNDSDQLNSIYRMQLVHARYLATDIDAVSMAWEDNNRRLEQFRILTATSAALQKQLDEAKISGAILDPQEIKKQVLGRFRLEEEEKTNAEFMFQLMQIFRNTLVSTKNYYRIEDLTRRMYNRLIEGNAFHASNVHIQLEMLFMHAQACYHNCRFDRAEELLNEAHALLPLKNPRKHPLYLRITSLHSMVLGYTKRVPEAMAGLRSEFDSGAPDREPSERANMWLNLAMCEFISGEHRQAIRTIQNIAMHHTAAWQRKHLGQEWVYKMELVEVVLLYDGGQPDAAEIKLEQMMIRYKDFLKGEIYERGAAFMRFVQQFFRNPDILKTPGFHVAVKAAGFNRHEHEDIHAITFFCWMKSKMLGQPFYEVLMERIGEQRQYHR